MSSTTLAGFESCRTDRTQTAPTDYQRPNPIPFSFGVPLDSVLGSNLFVLLKFEWHKANRKIYYRLSVHPNAATERPTSLLFSNCPAHLLDKLQKLQNSAGSQSKDTGLCHFSECLWSYSVQILFFFSFFAGTTLPIFLTSRTDNSSL